MKLTTRTIKPATPWNVTLAQLRKLERKIVDGERESMEARWLFGRELLGKRVDYKGRQVLPATLMAKMIAECRLSRTEIICRVQFAARYETKHLMSTAVIDYPTWYQMKRKGLVEKKRTPKRTTPSPARVIRRLEKELDKAYTQHDQLTRDQVKDLERLASTLQRILEQVDRNDEAKAS